MVLRRHVKTHLVQKKLFKCDECDYSIELAENQHRHASHIYIYAHTHIHTHTYTHTDILTHTYIYTHTYIHTHIHTLSYTHT